MPLWKSHHLSEREGELFVAFITSEDEKQLIAQVTSYKDADDIVFNHNAVIPEDHPTAIAVRVKMEEYQMRDAPVYELLNRDDDPSLLGR